MNGGTQVEVTVKVRGERYPHRATHTTLHYSSVKYTCLHCESPHERGQT